jgi:predicted membrane chloride channel (bestrophin family)
MPEIPANIWTQIWETVQAAGVLGAVVLAVALYFTRVDLRKEREKDEARHTATMDVLNAIKSFMEVIKDRIPRS